METKTPTKLSDFFSQFKTSNFKRGQVIIRDDTNPNGVYLLRKGNVRLFLNSENGEELTALILKPGDLFPLRWALNNVDNIYNFEALTDTELLSAPRDKFLEFIKGNNDILFEVASYSSFTVGALIYRMQHIVFGNAHAKVASILLTCAKRFGEGHGASEEIKIQIPLTHQDIATAAGITRETASIEMKKMEKRGVISYKSRSIVVQNLLALEEESYL